MICLVSSANMLDRGTIVAFDVLSELMGRQAFGIATAVKKTMRRILCEEWSCRSYLCIILKL